MLQNFCNCFGGEILAAVVYEGACKVAEFSSIRLGLEITLGVENNWLDS